MCPSLLPSTPRKARIKRAQEKQAIHTPRVIFSSAHARKACSEFPFCIHAARTGKAVCVFPSLAHATQSAHQASTRKTGTIYGHVEKAHPSPPPVECHSHVHLYTYEARTKASSLRLSVRQALTCIHPSVTNNYQSTYTGREQSSGADAPLGSRKRPDSVENNNTHDAHNAPSFLYIPPLLRKLRIGASLSSLGVKLPS